MQGFDGAWSVQWCDESAPQLDCGGFSVALQQLGDRVCGTCGGALVDRRQVDEGEIVGHADGGHAILEVRSGRNGSLVREQAERVGDALHWKQLETLREGSADISVIAIDEVLAPAGPPMAQASRCVLGECLEAGCGMELVAVDHGNADQEPGRQR